MIKPLISGLMLLATLSAYAQVQTHIVGDSIRIHSNTGSGELIVENSTKNVDGFLYNKGNGRTEFRMPQNYTPQTLTDGSTINWNLANGSYGAVTLTGTGRTLAISNPVAWRSYRLKIVQDSLGGKTITTWPSNILWPNGTQPSLSTNGKSVDVINLFYDGTNFYGDYSYKFATQGALTLHAFDGKYNAGPTTHTFANVPAGALLVVTAACGSSLANSTITSVPMLTWTKQADASAVNSGDAEIYTAVYTGGGSISVTSSYHATDWQNSVCYVILNQEATLSGATNTGTVQTQPLVNLTTTKANSLIIAVTSDWNARNGAATYRSSATQALYRYDQDAGTGYHYYLAAPTIGTYQMGLSQPTSQASGTAVLEIRGK